MDSSLGVGGLKTEEGGERIGAGRGGDFCSATGTQEGRGSVQRGEGRRLCVCAGPWGLTRTPEGIRNTGVDYLP